MQPEAAAPCCKTCYTDGEMYIRNAINALSACAKDDQVARDSIANLSVVLLDLKGGIQ